MRETKNRSRYSIGEWYGEAFEHLSGHARTERARIEIETKGRTGRPCPFNGKSQCFKKGGVCSLRLYEESEQGVVAGAGPLVTICRWRFLEQNTIFGWIGETLLQTSKPLVLSQIGLLPRLPGGLIGEEQSGREREYIGRLENILVHPSRDPIDWCALELQAVNFSGKAMGQEFEALGKHVYSALPFPAAHRRPYWRSFVPKRLLLQLQTKVPHITRWGKKTAVVIDEAFFGSLVRLEAKDDLSNADIAWFVVGYDQGTKWTLVPRKVVFSDLDSSVRALTGGKALPRHEFETQLLVKLAEAYPEHPLAKNQR
jgi:hypothetical protein